MGGVGQGGGVAESSVGATRGALVPLFGLPQKPNNWSDLAGGEGGWAREAGKGEMGGGTESSGEASRGGLFPRFGFLKNLTIGLIGGVGGRRGGGGLGRRARGRWGGGPQNRCIGSTFLKTY